MYKRQTKDLPIKINFSTNFFNFDYPIVAYVNVKNWSEKNVELNIHVDHYINPNLKDAEIYSVFDWQKSELVGRTDAQGNYSFYLSGQPKIYHITVIKKQMAFIHPAGL